MCAVRVVDTMRKRESATWITSLKEVMYETCHCVLWPE